MRSAIFSLLMFVSSAVWAEGSDVLWESSTKRTLDLVTSYDNVNVADFRTLIDFIDKDKKVKACIVEYIDKQTKSYAKKAQNNLYELLHNFDNVLARIQGKIPSNPGPSFEEKIEALANVQCDAYYALRVLR